MRVSQPTLSRSIRGHTGHVLALAECFGGSCWRLSESLEGVEDIVDVGFSGADEI